MKILKLILTVGALLSMFIASRAQEGEQIFRSNCASCHSIGKGKLVGPDLQEVHSRHDEQWLQKWVKSSQTLVKAGDEQAVKLYNDNNKVPMPDAFINEDQIKTVLAFIKTKGEENSLASSEGTKASVAEGTVVSEGSPAALEKNVSLMNMFSFSEYMLISVIALLMVVIWGLARTIKSLSIDVERKYNSDDYL